VKLNGFDKTNQYSRQTVETAEVHRPLSSSSSSSPSDTAVNHEALNEDTDHNMNVVVHNIPDLSDGLITKNDPEPDSYDDTDLPSPPASARNYALGLSATTKQNSITADEVFPAHSDLPPAAVTDSPDQPDTSVSRGSPPLSMISPSTFTPSPLPPAPPPPPTPPPAPPLSVLPPAPKPQQSNTAGTAQKAAASRAKLEEIRRQDAKHAELMAAVLRRKKDLENSDPDQLVKNIESKIKRNSKGQTVFRATSSEQRTSRSEQRGSTSEQRTSGSEQRGSTTESTSSSEQRTSTSEQRGSSSEHQRSSVMPVALSSPSDMPDSKPGTQSNTDAPVIDNGMCLLGCRFPVNLF